MGSDGVASWTQPRIIDLKNLLPIQNPSGRIKLIGSLEGSDIIFVTTDLGIYEINIKSQQWKKLWKNENIFALIPYMSFYNRQSIFVYMHVLFKRTRPWVCGIVINIDIQYGCSFYLCLRNVPYVCTLCTIKIGHRVVGWVQHYSVDAMMDHSFT